MNTEPVDEPLNLLCAKGLWQRLPNESADAYSAFVAYLELGFDSTLADVAEKTGRSHKAIRNLSSRHSWLERSAAWRQHTALATFAAMETEHLQAQKLWALRLETSRERRWERLQKLDMVCDQALNKLAHNSEAEFATHELTNLLRLTSECEEKAVAHVPEPEVTPDKSNDPIIRQFHAYVAKVVALSKKNAVPPAQPAPTPSTPDAAVAA